MLVIIRTRGNGEKSVSNNMAITHKINSEGLATEFLEIVERCYVENPNKNDLKTLEKWVKDYPFLWSTVLDLAVSVRGALIDKVVSQEAGQIGIRANVKAMQEEMGYNIVPMVERLLIDNVINSWLRYQWAEYQLASFMGEPRVTFSEIEYWEKRLTATQRRYLRAIETLARVRKITRNTPMLQVNIATEGGQQINVVGDLVKEKQP